MPSFQQEFLVDAPIEKVAEFHSSTRALKQLNPPPIFVQLNQIEPLGEGSRSDFTLWLGPLPIRWVAVHSEVDSLTGFTDTQMAGPFKTWVHRHQFQSIDGDKTRVVDQIEAQPGDHPFWGLISRFMWLTLPILFSYRARQTRHAVEQR